MACVEPCDPRNIDRRMPIAHAPGKRTTSLQSLGRTLSLRSALPSGASTKQNTRAEAFAALSGIPAAGEAVISVARRRPGRSVSMLLSPAPLLGRLWSLDR